MILFVSTCMMGLVHCFSLFFFSLGCRERNWSELSYISFPGLTQWMLVVQLLVLRLGESTPEKQWAGNLTAANFSMETSSLQSARKQCCRDIFSWRYIAMRARNSQASDVKPRLGWKCWQGKRKKSLNLCALDMGSLRHLCSPVMVCFVCNMFLGILSLFCLYTGGSSSFESQ